MKSDSTVPKCELLILLGFVFFRLQDSLEFINQDSNTLKPDHSTIMNGLLGNIGN